MGSEGLHEPREALDDATVETHRGITSLIEELEAIDWYQQRADACGDPELKAILLHHKREEIEHAMINLEWLRRRNPDFAEQCDTYLFSDGPILAVEEAAKGSADTSPDDQAGHLTSSLRIGSLKSAPEAADQEHGP